MKSRRWIAPISSFLLFFMSVAYSGDVRAQQISVVASIFPLADMVQQVGSPHVAATFVVPAGASPHTFEPKPSQMKQIAAARVFFMIGAGLEIWAEKFVAAAGRDLLKVVLSDGIALIHSSGSMHTHPETEPAAGAVRMANPHIWLDPVIAQSMVSRIISVLCSADNMHADHYRRQGEIYLTGLRQLDKDIRSAVSTFSVKKYVAFHAAWDYFAKRYGLEPVGVIETAPGRNPTPRRIRQIIADIKKHRIRAVFAEPQLNPKVAVVIAEEADVRVLFLDPVGAPDVEGRKTYLELMRYNLDVLKEALQ